MANLLLCTGIVEALPNLEADEWNYFEINLADALRDENEVLAYAAFGEKAIKESNFSSIGVSGLILGFGHSPAVAMVNLELSKPPAGFIGDDSLHL